MRKFLACFLAVVMVLSLAACGKKDNVEADNGSQTTPPEQQDSLNIPVIIPDESEPSGVVGDMEDVGDVSDTDDVGDVSEPPADEVEPSDEDDIEPSDDGTKPSSAAVGEGEQTIASQFFNKSKIIAYDVRNDLGHDLAWVSDSVIDNIVSICNEFSVEGVSRIMADGGFPCGCMQDATVIICYMTGIPYEEAWQNGFWTKEDVDVLVAKLTGEDVKPNNMILDKEAGEKPMIETKYSGKAMKIEDIRKQLNISGAQVRDQVLTLAITFLSEYSSEGFLRTLAESSPETTEMGQAAVIVCRMTGVPMERVFEHDYMSEESVLKMVELLDDAEKSDPIYNQG